MAVRRVVTGEVNGKSTVVVDDVASGNPFWDEIWAASPSEPLGHDPGEADAQLEPPPGATQYRVVSVPPDEELKKILAEALGNDIADVEPDGFHKTKTLDYLFVLDGDITLQLEDGAVELRAGDCVVQRATNHAWHNYSDKPVRLLTIFVALP